VATAVGKAKWVLVVDDDADVRNCVVDLLESAGYAASAAPGGSEALIMMGEAAPALVLSDVSMREMDGRELLTRAQDLLGASMPPFVFMSGLPATVTGSEKVLPKPYDLGELLEVVQKHVQLDVGR
jgi:CheY-like chemotaxis protein